MKTNSMTIGDQELIDGVSGGGISDVAGETGERLVNFVPGALFVLLIIVMMSVYVGSYIPGCLFTSEMGGHHHRYQC